MFNIISHNTYKIQTLSWCQISGKIQGGIYSDRTRMQNNNNNNNADKIQGGIYTHTRTAFQEAFREDFVNIQTSSETISYDHSILET